jgi:hypothetical protein
MMRAAWLAGMPLSMLGSAWRCWLPSPEKAFRATWVATDPGVMTLTPTP